MELEHHCRNFVHLLIVVASVVSTTVLHPQVTFISTWGITIPPLGAVEMLLSSKGLISCLTVSGTQVTLAMTIKFPLPELGILSQVTLRKENQRHLKHIPSHH